MTAEEARAFIRANHHGVLATSRRDGGTQLSPVLVAVDDDGAVLVSTSETAAKTVNLRRRPYASICVLNDGFFGAWLQVEGPVTIEHLPEAMEHLVRYYRSVAGEHPDWDEYRAAMTRERRVLLRVEIERVSPRRPS